MFGSRVSLYNVHLAGALTRALLPLFLLRRGNEIGDASAQAIRAALPSGCSLVYVTAKNNRLLEAARKTGEMAATPHVRS